MVQGQVATARFYQTHIGKKYLQRCDTYLKQCVRKGSFVNQPVSTAQLRQEWFGWAAHQFQCKGYTPSVAGVMAESALTQCGSDYRSVEVMVNTTPLNPQSAFQELQRQNYQWAMGELTAKGYNPEGARHAINNALNIAGSDLTGFQQWVSDAPYAQSNNNAMHQKNKHSLKALGLSEASRLEGVEKAYKMLIKRYHPDRNPENVEESIQISQIITEAKKHLTEVSDLFKGQSR